MKELNRGFNCYCRGTKEVKFSYIPAGITINFLNSCGTSTTTFLSSPTEHGNINFYPYTFCRIPMTPSRRRSLLWSLATSIHGNVLKHH